MNTGHNTLDLEGSGAPFHCADLFGELNSRGGLIDLWRARHGERKDWTWRSNKNGFRIDHAFGNQALLNRYPNFRCEIEHEAAARQLAGAGILTKNYATRLDLASC